MTSPPPPRDLPSIMVALVPPNHCGSISHWQGGGMAVFDVSTATVSGTSYTECSAGEVSEWVGVLAGGGSTAASQITHVAHVNVWAMYSSH